MSSGTATARAHRRDATITRLILETDDYVWRTPFDWWTVVADAPSQTWRGPIGGYGSHMPNRAQVAVVLRRLWAEGDMERRGNPADKRSYQFRLAR